MERYIDMHCHILPGVDDGAQNMEDTHRMLQTAYDEGVRYIIATPHHHPRRGRARPQELRQQLRAVREEAEKISDRLKVFLGTEVYFGQDIPDKLKENEVLTMNRTKYVLVEFSPSDPFEYMQQGIQRIQMKGYIVILAHVERYDCMREDIERVEYFHEMGVLIQVNAGSITGNSGRRIRKFVKELLARELVFCVGTDAHDDRKRAPHMKKAAEYVKKKYGEEYARRIFFGNAAEMLKKKKKNESRQSNES
ncbi:CpsB/CapC family capsule biosynthesis tyrosine phosphatase [Mordavella massiliensis]|uniref:protein-tyrosine-phosphatase n=1 Tax=Mordavella massiliensis TaxID=1871024 RepID=A0A938XE69_9CLOT|nr:CpsB/CapC family capsule biosynthesis tyrosine phosphatase [Mordavella massiliensis]MBM6949099.1 protein tyrosine phosphatase [Mordavella massiliensis]